MKEPIAFVENQALDAKNCACAGCLLPPNAGWRVSRRLAIGQIDKEDPQARRNEFCCGAAHGNLQVIWLGGERDHIE